MGQHGPKKEKEQRPSFTFLRIQELLRPITLTDIKTMKKKISAICNMSVPIKITDSMIGSRLHITLFNVMSYT